MAAAAVNLHKSINQSKKLQFHVYKDILLARVRDRQSAIKNN